MSGPDETFLKPGSALGDAEKCLVRQLHWCKGSKVVLIEERIANCFKKCKLRRASTGCNKINFWFSIKFT